MVFASIHIIVALLLFIALGVRNKIKGKDSDTGEMFLVTLWPLFIVGFIVGQICWGCYDLGGLLHDLYIKFKG